MTASTPSIPFGWPGRLRFLLSVIRATWTTSFAEAWSNRRGFWLQISAMLVNDIVWLLFWLIFFDRFGTVRGWAFDDMVVLMSVLTVAGGLSLGLLANCRQIAWLIADGDLDAALALPVPTLPYLLTRRIDVVFLGDVVFGLALFVLLATPSPRQWLIFAVCVLTASALLVGFLVLIGCTAFFLGRSEIGGLGFHAITLFAFYPIDLFAGPTKLFLYAIIPAGFVSSVPVRLINDFDWRWGLLLAGVATTFLSAGLLAFQRGLRRYTSGAVWTDV